MTQPLAQQLTALIAAILHTEYGQRPRGILISGPSGAGKTSLVRTVLANFNEIHHEFASMYKLFGRSDTLERTKIIFTQASNYDKSIIVLDDLEVLSFEGSRELCKEIVLQIGSISTSSAVCTYDKIAVIGIVDTRVKLPSSILAPEILGHEFVVGMPSRAARVELFHTLCPAQSMDDCEFLSQITGGLSLRQIVQLVQGAIRAHGVNRDTVNKSHVLDYCSQMRRAKQLVSSSNGAWESVITDVAGYRDVISQIVELMVWPVRQPEMFHRLGVSAPTGLLLYGPTGCGKTTLVHSVARQNNLNFVSIKGPELFSKYIGEAEATVRRLFSEAREIAPCVLLFDEVDSIAGARDDSSDTTGSDCRVLAQLLNEIDGIESAKDVLIVGCTNRPLSELDPAMLRPGRLERALYVRNPTYEDRLSILQLLSTKTPIADDVSLVQLAAATDGVSCAALSSLFRRAALTALEENMQTERIRMVYFNKILGLDGG